MLKSEHEAKKKKIAESAPIKMRSFVIRNDGLLGSSTFILW